MIDLLEKSVNDIRITDTPENFKQTLTELLIYWLASDNDWGADRKTQVVAQYYSMVEFFEQDKKEVQNV